MPVQLRPDEMIALLEGDFQRRYEPNFAWKSAAALLRGLPGLRLAWTMGSFDENGDQFDVSGQGRTLSYNGTPTYGYRDLAPYIDLDGSGDYLDRADEAGLDILGTEPYVAASYKGLTCGIWFSPDRLTNNEKLVSKWTAAPNDSYLLEFRGDLANDPVRFTIGDAAGVDTVVLDSVVTAAGEWYFAAGRYEPSAEIKVWIGADGTLNDNTNNAGIPAALKNSNASLTLGAESGGVVSLFDGKLGLGFLCAAYLSDAIIAAIWEQTRAMFGG